MERLKELISQLKEQFDHKVEPSMMLQTTQLLEAELRSLASQPLPGRVMPTKIAVMMPSAAKIPSNGAFITHNAPLTNNAPIANGSPVAAAEPPAKAASNSTPVINGTAAINGSAAINGAAATNGAPTATGTAIAAANPASVAEPSAKATRGKEPERGVWPFDPLAEKPTDRFTLSQKSREINDIIGGAGTSRNEKLKSDIVDLRSALNDAPVRDLKKAIGINDRYVFVNQLFRGDEAMYERSIKTINAFRILPEAEYWMERELKVKLGWDENRDVTRHFYQLVKRRFS
jgi:hypothetical protein